VRQSKADYDFAAVRAEIMARGYLRTRTAYGGAKRLEAAGWLVAEESADADAAQSPSGSDEEASPALEIQEGARGVLFAVEAPPGGDGSASPDSSLSTDDETVPVRESRTKSYSQGEYGRLLAEQANRLAARQQEMNGSLTGSSPPATPSQPGEDGGEGGGVRKNSAIERFFGILESKKLRYMDLFKLIDVDDSGTVDAEELAAVFARHELSVSSEEVHAILQELDVDGNGDIDKREFLEQMRVAQNRRRILARDVSSRGRFQPVPPSRRRPATMETINSRRVLARARMEEAEREREAERVKERQRHEAMLRKAAKAKAIAEAGRMKAAAHAVKVQERQLQRVRMSGLSASYGSRLTTAILPPISHKPRGARRAGGTPRGTSRVTGTPRSTTSKAVVPAPMTA
jgi:hypothetical protein